MVVSLFSKLLGLTLISPLDILRIRQVVRLLLVPRVLFLLLEVEEQFISLLLKDLEIKCLPCADPVPWLSLGQGFNELFLHFRDGRVVWLELLLLEADNHLVEDLAQYPTIGLGTLLVIEDRTRI